MDVAVDNLQLLFGAIKGSGSIMFRAKPPSESGSGGYITFALNADVQVSLGFLDIHGFDGTGPAHIGLSFSTPMGFPTPPHLAFNITGSVRVFGILFRGYMVFDDLSFHGYFEIQFDPSNFVSLELWADNDKNAITGVPVTNLIKTLSYKAIMYFFDLTFIL